MSWSGYSCCPGIVKNVTSCTQMARWEVFKVWYNAISETSLCFFFPTECVKTWFCLREMEEKRYARLQPPRGSHEDVHAGGSGQERVRAENCSHQPQPQNPCRPHGAAPYILPVGSARPALKFWSQPHLSTEPSPCPPTSHSSWSSSFSPDLPRSGARASLIVPRACSKPRSSSQKTQPAPPLQPSHHPQQEQSPRFPFSPSIWDAGLLLHRGGPVLGVFQPHLADRKLKKRTWKV